MTKVRKKIGTIPINDIEQQVQQSTSAAITQMQQDVSDFIDEETAQYPEIGGTFKYIQDPEGRSEIKTDSEGKILSYRDSDGVMHEEVGIESAKVNTNSLNLTDEGMTEFQKALKDSGFLPGGKTDWSNYISNDGKNPLEIPMPRCAMINILSDFDLTQLSKAGYTGSPAPVEGVNYDIPTEIEFWDMQGNYFKKPVLMSAQGTSSMLWIKKNIAFDFFDTSVEDDKVFAIKFGDWLPFDSFHLKAFYTDFFKGVSICAYHIANIVDMSYNISKNRVWKRALLPANIGSDSFNYTPIDNVTYQSDGDARCMPDAFPVIVYQNGVFFGVYAWCIKKHRDNYMMNKSNPMNIHLDGKLNNTSLWNNDPSAIQWTEFEIRNPKNLCYAVVHNDLKGKSTFKYDADIPNGEDEIAGTDKNYDGDWIAGTYAVGRVVKKGSNYFINQVANNNKEPITEDLSGNKNTAKDPDFKNKTKCGWVNCTNSVKVKQAIQDFAIIRQRIDNASTTEDKKAVLETYLDKENLIDYNCIQLAVGDWDSYNKNWQWVTYDGIKWYVCEYDKDCSFGANAEGGYIYPPRYSITHGDYTMAAERSWGIMQYVDSLYMNEFRTRWSELRQSKLIDKDAFMEIIKSWIQRIGSNNFKLEYDKWVDAPCNREMVINNGWSLVDNLDNMGSYSDYNSETQYQENDICKYHDLKFEATESIIGVEPIAVLGTKDNIFRLSNWIAERIRLEDIYMNYNQN